MLVTTKLTVKSGLTGVPSGTSWNVKTLNAIGSDLLDLQWLGRGEQSIQGDPVGTSSPCSPRNSCIHWSGTIISVIAMSYTDNKQFSQFPAFFYRFLDFFTFWSPPNPLAQSWSLKMVYTSLSFLCKMYFFSNFGSFCSMY